MRIKTRQTVAKTFETLGYIAVILQWAWALILLVPPLLKIDSIHSFIMPKPSHHVVHQQATISLPPFVTFLIVAFAFLVVIVGVYFAFKSPAYAVRAADKSAKKAATTIAHHTAKRPDNTREVRQLSLRVLWRIKWSAVLVGFILSLIASQMAGDLDPTIVVVAGGYLASWSVLWFGVQYLFDFKK